MRNPLDWTALARFVPDAFFAAELNPSGGGRVPLLTFSATEARMNLERWLYVATALSMVLAVTLTVYSSYRS